MSKLSALARAVLGFLIAPVIPVIVLILPAAVRGDSTALAQFFAYSKVSYCATLLIALPAHLLLRKRHWTLLTVYAAIGAAMGLAIFLVQAALGVPSRTPGLGPMARTLLSLPVDAIGGVIILTCFWLIARPDRD